MDDQMERRAPWIPWMITSAALLIVAAVGYNRPWPDRRDDWEEWHRQAHRRMDSSRESAPGSDHGRPLA